MNVHPHEAVVTKLYESFRALDADAMATCYHPNATFSDPVFRDLRGAQVPKMWRMLVTSARDFTLTYRDVRADDHSGSAHWEADYTFSRSRRPVHNVIDARFGFEDGLIARHVDSFDLWKWSRMALGATGALLGWSPLVQGKIRADAARRLAAFDAPTKGP